MVILGPAAPMRQGRANRCLHIDSSRRLSRVTVDSRSRSPHYEVMPFPVGSEVAVVNLRKHGRVLEVLAGGRYRIAVGGLTMICQERHLETVSHSKKQQRREREAPARRAESALPAPAAPAADSSRFQSIDLHGMTVPEALAALPVFLDCAIRAGLTQVEIIHGISGGRLRVAVRQYLAEMPAVTCAARDDGNPGVTIAYFGALPSRPPDRCSRQRRMASACLG